jgi:hypothetical protein
METISADDLLELQQRAETLSPKKLVIVAGPSFGTVVKFLLFGAALGAAGVMLLRDKSHAATENGTDASTPVARNRVLLARAKSIASRARAAAQMVAEFAKPVIEDAIQQGRKAARQTERDLEAEISQEEG